MSVTTLTCSGKRKHYGLMCQALAVWAIKGADGYWHGACHQHPHQVLKRLGADGTKLTVQLATEAMAENARLRNLPGVLTRAEELVEVLRPLVLEAADLVPGRTGGDDRWTVHRVRLILKRHADEECDDAVAAELLELLDEENVVEHQGEGVYVCVASLPG
jgi:hypothetical protein